ncbi:MAG: hypothetical protein JRI54_00270 [Deltaproteobacteria bacterium]|nr:hypothetical protein [Deltaproteobacteria bacterium]
MQPLKITAYMQTGKIATYDLFLPLDSILAEVWIRLNHPEAMIASQSSIMPENLIVPDLPLEKRGEDDDWYWACSFACGKPQREEIVHWHKRLDFDDAQKYIDFGKKRGKVNVKSGQYKNYRMPLVTYLMPKLEWYAVGEKNKIEILLKYVTHIGKKRSQGFGRVVRWTVGEWPEDLSYLRAIPDENGDVEMGIRSPYWLAWQWTRVLIPNDRRLACNANQTV